jgi:acetyltransferase-like isoleucine patch superfamily enzyme
MLSKIEYFLSKLIKKIHLRAIINSHVDKTTLVYAGSHLVNVRIGRYSNIGYDNTLINVEIGSFCAFGKNVTIGGASHTLDWVSISSVFNNIKDGSQKKFSNHHFSVETKTFIGNDVWIGDNVLVKGGIVVADGAVLGMGSVVTKNVPPFEIWAGNPAKFIRKRFKDDEIVELLKMEWWDWEDDKISRYAPYFNNVAELINKYTI